MLRFRNMSAIRQLRPCVALMRAQVVGVSGNGNGNGNGTATPSRVMSSKTYNVPPSSEFVARVSGIATMAKLPYQDTAEGLDAAFIGVPIDTGTSNRPGTRFAHARAYHSYLSFSHFFTCHGQKACTWAIDLKTCCICRIFPSTRLSLGSLLSVPQFKLIEWLPLFCSLPTTKCSIFSFTKRPFKFCSCFILVRVTVYPSREHWAHR